LTKKELFDQLTEINLIVDEDIRDKTTKAILCAAQRGGWEQKGGLTKCPVAIGKPISSCPDGWLGYTRILAGVCEEMLLGMGDWIRSKIPCDHDIVISGAILSGIGKLLEYDLDDKGKPCLSKEGLFFRYPISGAWIADECGLPEKVVHIIVSISKEYSPEGDKAKRTPESIIVKNAEDLCFGVLKAIEAVKTL